MGVSLPAQVSSLLYSLLLGIAAALLYDLLRAVRMRRKRLRLLSEALDVLYCVSLAALCFFFALRIGGGELRIYMLLGALLGAVFYFALLADLFRPLWDFWAETLFALLHLLRLPFRFLKTFYGKLTKLCKRLFLFFGKLLYNKNVWAVCAPGAPPDRAEGGACSWQQSKKSAPVRSASSSYCCCSHS